MSKRETIKTTTKKTGGALGTGETHGRITDQPTESERKTERSARGVTS